MVTVFNIDFSNCTGGDGIKKEIEETDKIIDHEVYKLYELTEKEIKIIENN